MMAPPPPTTIRHRLVDNDKSIIDAWKNSRLEFEYDENILVTTVEGIRVN